MGNPFKKMTDHVFFDWRQVGIALVKAQGIHDGLWRAGLSFDMHAMMANMTLPSGRSEKVPSALICVANVNLKQMTEKDADALTIDAAVENPRPRLVTVN